jgi:hypothetical protein
MLRQDGPVNVIHGGFYSCEFKKLTTGVDENF